MHANPHHRFGTREEAGRKLADRLSRFAADPDVVVLAVPRGGVLVGAEISRVLNKPFDVLLVGKIHVRHGGKTMLGAITTGGVRLLDCATIDRLHLEQSEVRAAILKESLKLAHRERLYRGQRPSLEVADKTVILADDGTTSCETICQAVRLLRRRHVDRVVLALPVACRHSACSLRMETVELVTLSEPESAKATEKWFAQVPQASVDHVRDLLTVGPDSLYRTSLMVTHSSHH